MKYLAISGLLDDVKPGQHTKLTLNRFRPWSHQPFESVELFTGK